MARREARTFGGLPPENPQLVSNPDITRSHRTRRPTHSLRAICETLGVQLWSAGQSMDAGGRCDLCSPRQSELILKSRRVVPSRLLQSGFSFQHPTWTEAFADVCRTWMELDRGAVESMT
jgi:hypothetical protein